MIKEKDVFYKSCLNYTGGKYKLLHQIIPLFPSNINNFFDLFCGGANVAINMSVKGNIYCVDKQKQVIRLFNTLQTLNINDSTNIISSIIKEYNLSNTYLYNYEKYNCNSSTGLAAYNKENYLKLRNAYNNRIEDNTYYDLVFYVLTVYSFNNQIRFNKKEKFNMPIGKRDLNKNIRNNLNYFTQIIQNKNISFTHSDYLNFDINLNKDDFVYVDPPYLISHATYNEQNAWREKDEIQLLDFLDDLNSKSINFALSNIFEHKGKENEILKKWSTKYNVCFLDYNYNNSNYQAKNHLHKTKEVLITNYENH